MLTVPEIIYVSYAPIKVIFAHLLIDIVTKQVLWHRFSLEVGAPGSVGGEYGRVELGVGSAQAEVGEAPLQAVLLPFSEFEGAHLGLQLGGGLELGDGPSKGKKKVFKLAKIDHDYPKSTDVRIE